jgi:hypothetical protein
VAMYMYSITLAMKKKLVHYYEKKHYGKNYIILERYEFTIGQRYIGLQFWKSGNIIEQHYLQLTHLSFKVELECGSVRTETFTHGQDAWTWARNG